MAYPQQHHHHQPLCLLQWLQQLLHAGLLKDPAVDTQAQPQAEDPGLALGVFLNSRLHGALTGPVVSTATVQALTGNKSRPLLWGESGPGGSTVALASATMASAIARATTALVVASPSATATATASASLHGS